MSGTPAFVRSQKRRLRHLHHLSRVREPHPGRSGANSNIPRCRVGRHLQTKRFCVPIELRHAKSCGVYTAALRPDSKHGRITSDEHHRGYQAGLQTGFGSQGSSAKPFGHVYPDRHCCSPDSSSLYLNYLTLHPML